MQGEGFKVEGSGLWVWSLAFGGLKVRSSAFLVEGFLFRAFRVLSC